MIVDEAHQLEGHVSGFLAGFTIAPGPSLPTAVYNALPVDRLLRVCEDESKDMWLFRQLDDDLYGVLDDFVDSAKLEIKKLKATMPTENEIAAEADENRFEELKSQRDIAARQISQLETLLRKIDWARDDEANNRPWVVDLEIRRFHSNQYYNRERAVAIRCRPVDVDRYLQENLWHRTPKRILSSATLPYPNNPKRWAEDIGLDPDDTHVVKVPMGFPTENRPIHTHTTIGKMSSGGFDDHFDQIVREIRRLAAKHDGEKGLVHCVSFDRAQRLYEPLSDIAILHDPVERRQETYVDDNTFLNRWQLDGEDAGEYADKNVLLSPSMDEGVDLRDEMCRWQVIPKVPYADIGDSRVKYFLDERNDWTWYKNKAATSVVQAGGRGVRSETDYCDTYVLDKCFHDIAPRYVPDWFYEAVQF